MCHCDCLFQSPVIWNRGTDLIFLSKDLIDLFGYLFVAEAELDGDGVEGGIPGGITWVLAGLGSLSKEVHSFNLADKIVYHLTCSDCVVTTLQEVVSSSFYEGRSHLSRDGGRVKEGGLAKIEIVYNHGFLGIPYRVGEKVSVVFGFFLAICLIFIGLCSGFTFVGASVGDLLPLAVVN
jgi:hypothetical protein